MSTLQVVRDTTLCRSPHQSRPTCIPAPTAVSSPPVYPRVSRHTCVYALTRHGQVLKFGGNRPGRASPVSQTRHVCQSLGFESGRLSLWKSARVSFQSDTPLVADRKGSRKTCGWQTVPLASAPTCHLIFAPLPLHSVCCVLYVDSRLLHHHHLPRLEEIHAEGVTHPPTHIRRYIFTSADRRQRVTCWCLSCSRKGGLNASLRGGSACVRRPVRPH